MHLPRRTVLLLVVAALAAAGPGIWFLAVRQRPIPVEAVLAAYNSRARYGPLSIEYPPEGAVFPPEIVPPTFRWQEHCPSADRWVIAVELAAGERLTSAAESTRWQPLEDAWKAIKQQSRSAPAQVTILGVNHRRPTEILSAGRVSLRTSADEVGAPLFYREVHLPFIEAVTDPARHIRWRFGTIDMPHPPVVLEGLPNCANCHSFSADGLTMGMDVDYGSDKGSYVIVPVAKEMVLDTQKIITWSDFRPEDKQPTFGLLPRVSPDGKYSIAMVKDRSVFVDKPDFAFSQLFFPIRGVLAYYDIEAKAFHPLPGADDPDYVQANPVWSPDGKYVVFARQKAYDLKNLRHPESSLLDWEDVKEFVEEGKTFQYDLYRVEFNGGRGGTPEPLRGASQNGKSNYFAKYSPDGKWIVFCQARSYMLLQPDSELYIIPAEGGQARRLECNTGKMNSWHSWSPNGRWLVFSSKAYSPYTQLFLTHIDPEGRSTPPVVLDHLTASDRAANIPEFCDGPGTAIARIRQDFVTDYNYYRAGHDAIRESDYQSAVRQYRKAIELNPGYVEARQELGVALMSLKNLAEAEAEFRKVIELRPSFAEAYLNLGNVLARQGKFQEAIDPLRKSLDLKPADGSAHLVLGTVLSGLGHRKEGREHLFESARLHPVNVQAVDLVARGDSALDGGRLLEAVGEYRRAVETSPEYVPALLSLASVLAACEDDSVRSGQQAIDLAYRAGKATGPLDPYVLAVLAAAYAEAGQFGQALPIAEQALQLAQQEDSKELSERLHGQLLLYQAQKPYRLPAAQLKNLRHPPLSR